METTAYALIVVGDVVEKETDEYTSNFLNFLEQVNKQKLQNNDSIEKLNPSCLLVDLRDELYFFSRIVSMAKKNNLSCYTIFFKEKPIICSSKNS